ncbi:MAG TPA: tetratricopeptide repeat protein, partial [Thermoplasmata archaeon]|nr:tetratricopeptide repeat protein [Thermoplasmata archaeon]
MLTPNKDSQWEAQVKNLLLQQPNDSDLNFMLGSYYAKQKDWLKAESFFKKASALSSQSAEILLNYAVSLDHLGRYALARQYYQKTLAVAKGQLPSAT